MRVEQEHLSDTDIQQLLDDTFESTIEHRRHLMVCHQCQDTLLDYKLLTAQLGMVTSTDQLPATFTQSVMNRLAELDEQASVRRKWYVLPAVGSIVAMLVATGIALIADFQPLLPGVKDLLIAGLSAELAAKIQPTITAVQSALKPTQPLAFATAAALALSLVSLVEAALLRPLKARLGR